MGTDYPNSGAEDPFLRAEELLFDGRREEAMQMAYEFGFNKYLSSRLALKGITQLIKEDDDPKTKVILSQLKESVETITSDLAGVLNEFVENYIGSLSEDQEGAQ